MAKLVRHLTLAAVLLALPVAASASAFLASDALDIDIQHKSKSFVTDQSMSFDVAKNGTKMMFSITVAPDHGTSGSFSDLDVALRGPHDPDLHALGVTHDKRGDTIYTFEDTLHKGHYTLLDSFTSKNGWHGQVTAQIAAVPEPSTYALIALGIGAIALVKRRQRGVTASALGAMPSLA